MMLKAFVSLLLVSGVRAEPPDDFHVKFVTETGGKESSFVVDVFPSWAPIGAERFRDLVEQKFFDDTTFFRVVPNFVVQFGLSGNPKVSSEWREKTIKDDPVKESNKEGYITFAKTGAPNSRTTQLFVNY